MPNDGNVWCCNAFIIIIFKYWTYKLYKPTQLSYTNQLCILHCCAKEPIRYAFLFLTSFLWNAHTHTHTNHLLLLKLLAVLVQMERPDVLDSPELVSGTELTLNHLNDLCTVFEECRWKEVVCNRLPNIVLVPCNICDHFSFVYLDFVVCLLSGKHFACADVEWKVYGST